MLSPLAESVKDYLKVYVEEEKEIDNQIERLGRLTSKMEGLSAVGLSDMPRAPSPKLDRLETMMIQKVALEEAIADAIRVHEAQKIYMNRAFMSLSSKERGAMQMRYIDDEEWSVICECLFGGEEDFYDKRDSYERRVYRLHDSALEKLAKNWNNRQM